MTSMVGKQGGEVLEEVELELADDRAHQFSQDHDEGRDPALDVPGGRQNPKLGPLLARGSLWRSVPVPDMPAAVFDIPIPPAHIGVAILVFVQCYFVRIALILQALTRGLAQMAKRVDVAHEDTPRRPAGRFRPVVPPPFVPIVKLAHQLHHLFVWCAEVRRIAPECLELVDR
jgi:hypothetical protein